MERVRSFQCQLLANHLLGGIRIEPEPFDKVSGELLSLKVFEGQKIFEHAYRVAYAQTAVGGQAGDGPR